MSDLKQRLDQLSPEKRALLEKRAARLDGRSTIPRRAPGDACPLSASQQRLWFLEQMEPGNAAYNVYRAVLLRGPLDADALRRSLNESLRRHEVLRTNFPAVGGLPAQRILATAEIELPLRDLAHLPPGERLTEALRLATEQARVRFDLARDLLLRTSLIRLDREEHVLALTTHHIAVDGWSVGILFREIVLLYEAFARGLPSPLPDPPVQFADFAVWERKLLSPDYLAKLLAYWRHQLADMPPALTLPVDRPRPPVQGSRGARYHFRMDGLYLGELKALGQRENATLFMTLLGAFQALLSFYTGQHDIAVGSPMACREVPELEALIGCFSNTLVLRTDISGDPSFRELLRRVRETVLGGLAHELMPFDRLVEALNPRRDPAYMTLVQVNFRLLTAPLPPAAGGGLRFEFLEIDNQRCKFDLALELLGTPGGLEGFLEYSTDLFFPESMPSIASDYEDLLRAAAASPDVPLSALGLSPRFRRSSGAAPGMVRRKPIYLAPAAGRKSDADPAQPARALPRADYQLRAATMKDAAFLYDLRLLTMKEYVSRMPGWSRERQEAFYMDFEPRHHHLIIVDGKPVGAVGFIEKPDELYWFNLHLLPEVQARGLGTAISRQLVRMAHSRGVPIRGKTLKANAITQKMMAKAGMKICGETSDRFLWVAFPPNQTDAPNAESGC